MSGANSKKRVAIVGAGAAGMSAAYALSQHPELFDVVLFERSSYTGGMATSSPIDKDKHGANYINDGVQGCSPVFYNTLAVLEKLGFRSTEVEMQVSFGRDAEEDFWTNVFPSQVIERFRPDIKKFGKVLKIVKVLEPLFALISVTAMLKMFGFSKDFGEVIVYPLVALFFGTGNQTPHISAAILERVFMDPNMRLFEYSSSSFLASIPKMRAFPKLSSVYDAWKQELEKAGNVMISVDTEVTRVKRRKKVELWSRPTKGTNNDQEVVDPGQEIHDEFDEMIIATDADAALRFLGGDASWLEKRILGNVKYLWDITITHNDLEYMQKYYRTQYSDELRSKRRDDEPRAQEQFKKAEDDFRPLYYIRSYPSNKQKIEMSFDLTNYQPQGIPPRGPGNHEATSRLPGSDAIPLDKHVFQTIFLDKDGSGDLWSKDEIDPDKVIMRKWWKQQSHRWQHYGGTVPWMMAVNGKRHTHFAGAWTILNMHEIAVVSGFAAAYRLGAKYPFNDDDDCRRLFLMCLALSHGVRMRKADRKGFFA